jgi:hypothetical protein
MVNAHFECKHISQFKGLIDLFNCWKWKDREGQAQRRDVGSIQTATSFGYWIITGTIKHGFRSGLYGWKAKA